MPSPLTPGFWGRHYYSDNFTDEEMDIQSGNSPKVTMLVKGGAKIQT